MVKLAAIVLSFTAVVSGNAQEPWPALARRDLAAIRDVLMENHPGPVDRLNPGFRSWLDVGYSQALAATDSVRSLDGVIAVVSRFTSGFEDGHLGWGSEFVRKTQQWPGIVVARRGGRYVAHTAASWVGGGPTPGSEILSCGGVSLDDRMTREVMPFLGGIPALEASRTRLAPALLAWDGNPWRTRPATCRLREGGTERDVALTWRSISADSLDRLQAVSAYGESPSEFGITHPRPGVAWVTVPSLAENVGGNRRGLDELVRLLPAARRARWIVFDVRGNRGGNTYWARQLLAAVFGAAYIDSVATALTSREYVQWRASSGNLAFIETSTLPRFDKGSAAHEALVRTAAAIRSAIAVGDDLTPAPSGNSSPRAQPATVAHELGSRFVPLTDGWCASACLGLADIALAIPGVRHAGAVTYADAIYIDNRSIRLPSGLGMFGFSMKVYRNRPRGHNQAYTPSLTYSGLVWNTPTLQEWLMRALAVP